LIEYYREIKGADSADGDGDGDGDSDSDSDSYGDSGVRNPSKCQMHLLVVLIRDQKKWRQQGYDLEHRGCNCWRLRINYCNVMFIIILF